MPLSTKLVQRESLWARIRAWIAAHPNGALALAVVIFLGPFVAKPFNMDDPLFIWGAQQIHLHPLNPFGFDVNWYGTNSPMWHVTENPPLGCYYVALAATVLGWSEPAMHLAFLLPAVAVILGTHRLARRLCETPMLAAGATLVTPVFLISSATVMCDVLMLAFWVWAAVLWVEGIEVDNYAKLAGAGTLIAMAALTKYFGLCLVPLLAFYSVMVRRGFGRWAGCLLIPLLALAAYQWGTLALYGQAHLSQAAAYAASRHGMFNGAPVAACLTALSFTGGCVAVVIFLAPWLWRRQTLLALTGLAVLLSLAAFLEGGLWKKYGWLQGTSRFSTEMQIVLWTVGGVCVLSLAFMDVWRRRDAAAWLLASWVVGTFIFTAFFNWTINGRSILPMAPAVGILLARNLRSDVYEGSPTFWRPGWTMAWVGAALFAFLAAQSDFVLATAVRVSAMETGLRYKREGQPLWFQGHWGFQYYINQVGGLPQDIKQPGTHRGEYLAVPLNNANLKPPTDGPGEELFYEGPRFLTTMNINIGAGFYSSQAGPLPFAFGSVPSEEVIVYRWRKKLSQAGD